MSLCQSSIYDTILSQAARELSVLLQHDGCAGRTLLTHVYMEPKSKPVSAPGVLKKNYLLLLQM